MDDPAGVHNFTPLSTHQKPKSKKSFLFLFFPFLVIIVAVISLVSYLQLSKKPQVTKPKAGFHATKVCNGSPGQTKGTVNIAYIFGSAEQCAACRDNGSCPAEPAALVGQPPACQNSNTTCVPGSPLSCTIPAEGGSCTFSVPVPDCSVYQIDCGDGAWPSLGSISGGIEFNCSGCGENPTSPAPTTPIPTTPVPTTPIPTTPIPTTPVPTTPVPTTPIPTTPVPGTLVCGTKGCRDNTNPCKNGLSCVQSTDENYCSLPQLTDKCKQNPTFDNCCNAGNTGTLACGAKGCRDDSNPCKSGLTCVQGTDENYCSLPQLTTQCKTNSTFGNCCSAPSTTVTPTAVKPTILQTGGESRMWYLVPLGIILGGLLL